MPVPSLRDQIAELLGEEDPLAAPRREPEGQRPPKRLPIAQAMRACPRPGIVAALHRGLPVALAVLADGSTVILTDNCPHDGGLISDGFVDGEQIVCARHGWEFDARTGQCSHRPGLSVPCAVFAEGTDPVDS